MERIKRTQIDLTLMITLLLGIISILLFGGFADSSTWPQTGDKSITVYAASGTMKAMQQAAGVYKSQTGCDVLLNFASSSTLARQITAGASFDVYISANPVWMDYVQDKSLINSTSRRDLLTDRLVLIAPTTSKHPTKNRSIIEILSDRNSSIAVGDPAHVPCGMYAKEALTALNCWDSIQNRVIPAASVRAAQQYVESGQCELGIVYKATAMQSKKVRIVSVIDQSLHSPIRFSVAGAVNSDQGNSFLEFLNQGVAMKIFTEAGFNPYRTTHLLPAQNTSVESMVNVGTWQSLMISLKVATTCTLVVAAPGILLGYILARKSFPGRLVINAIVHLPLVIPPVVTGYLALLLLGKNSLVGKWLNEVFGIKVAFSWTGAVVVSAIMGLPLLIRSVKTAVEMIDHRYSLAAGTLGAGPIRTFFTVTIPLAAPGILAGLVLAFARCLGEFGATATFAGNIPGKTQTLSLAIYSFTQIPGAESAAMRLVALSILLSMAAMLVSEWMNQRMKHLAGTT